jgi:hypothetical protein
MCTWARRQRPGRLAPGPDGHAPVFAPSNGHDTLYDLEHRKDKIDLRAFASVGISSFGDLDIESIGGNTIIHFDFANDITVKNVALLKQDPAAAGFRGDDG